MAADEDKRPAARPNAPDLQRQRSSSSRPGRPDRRSSATRPAAAKPAPPVIAETTVIAPPPPEPPRPSPFASRAFRQTLFPPTLVCGVGLAAIGSAYFLAPADATSLQWPAAAAVGVIAVGGVCLVMACLLAVSLRR